MKIQIPPENWWGFLVRGLALITTVDEEGRINAAPFAAWMPVSGTTTGAPLNIALSVRPLTDTYKNIVRTKEFTLNLHSKESRKKVYSTAKDFPSRTNELESVGLGWIPSIKVKPPRVEHGRIHFECSLNWMKSGGDHMIIVANVVAVSADKDIVSDTFGPNIESKEFIFYKNKW